MIGTKEVMIGDLVYNSNHEVCKVYSISNIFESKIYLDNLQKDDGCFEVACEVEPIPITPEILKKNGFEEGLDKDNIECYRYYNIGTNGYEKITLWDCSDGYWRVKIINYEKFNDNDINDIIYKNDFMCFNKVHQLQHVLKLCDIKKEIIV